MTTDATALRGLPAEELGQRVREVTAEQNDARVRKDVSGDLVVKAPFFHHGDLHVAGNLLIYAPFLVTGDVVVGKVLKDCGPDSVVGIGGNVSASSVHTDGDFHCGDITAQGVVYGYYNDHMLYCAKIRARVVIADDHGIDCGKVTAEIDYSDLNKFAQGYGKGVVASLRRVFVDDLFRADEFDQKALVARLLDGRELFKPGPPLSTKKKSAKKKSTKKKSTKKKSTKKKSTKKRR